MEHTLNKIKAGVAGVCGAVTAVFGWLGWLVIGWTACMALDYLTGSMAAAKAGDWSSGKAREGIWHKCGMIAVVAVAAAADGLFGTVVNNLPGLALPFSYGALVCPLVLCWYIVTELGSICENAQAMGAVLPPFLQKLLAAVKEGTEKAGGLAEDGKGKKEK